MGRPARDCTVAVAVAAAAVAVGDDAVVVPGEGRDIGCWDIVAAACADPSESRVAMGSSGGLHAAAEDEASADRRPVVEVVVGHVGAVAAAVEQHTGPTTTFAGAAEAGSCLADCPRVDSTSDPARRRC